MREDDVFFCTFLMYHLDQIKRSKQSDSYKKFGPYLELLPQNINDIPRLFDQDTLELLKGSPINYFIRNEVNESYFFYKELIMNYGKFRKWSEREFS